MGRALFYHLTRSTPEALAPRLIARALGGGLRVELRGADAGVMKRLDDLLWLQEGFTPHSRAGGPHDARQPVLLRVLARDAGDPGAPANGAACILSLDGAPVAPDLCAAAERVCILFNGNDEAAKEVARDQWRALVAAGQGADYWSEASGGWRKERSSDGA